MSKEIIYYCEQRDPYCISPKCKCNTVKPKEEIKHVSLVEKLKPLQEQWQRDMEKSLNPDKEALQEAAEKEYPEEGEDSTYCDLGLIQQNAFIAGANWQAERMYSEEEVLKQLNILQNMKSSLLDTYTDNEDNITIKWFEQFKK